MMTKTKNEQRKKKLGVWLNDLLQQMESAWNVLPSAIKDEILDFLAMPSKTATSSSSSSSSSTTTPGNNGIGKQQQSSSQQGGSRRPSGKNMLSSTSMESEHTHFAAPPPPPNRKFPKEWALTKALVKSYEYIQCTWIRDKNPRRIHTDVLCISRSSSVITSSSSPLLTTPWGDCLVACFEHRHLVPLVLLVALFSFRNDNNNSNNMAVSLGVSFFSPLFLSFYWAKWFLIGLATYLVLVIQQQLAARTQKEALANEGGVASALSLPKAVSDHVLASASFPIIEALLKHYVCDDALATSSGMSAAAVEEERRRIIYTDEPEEDDEAEEEEYLGSPQQRARQATRSTDFSTQEFDDFAFDDLIPEARKIWRDARETHAFQVRGPTYLEDNTKVYPGNAMCKLMLMELYEVEPRDGDRHDHVVSKGLAKERLQAILSLPHSPFLIVVNYQIPGDPPVSLVAYFALPPDLLIKDKSVEAKKFKALFDKFVDMPRTESDRLAAWGISPSASAGGGGGGGAGGAGGESAKEETASTTGSSVGGGGGGGGGGWLKVPSDIQWPLPQEPGALPQSDFRNARFKLVPLITDGPWIVKATVPSKPAILGKKVVQRYFRGENYLEIDVHVGSSIIASQITSLCRGFVRHFSADLGIVIQGEDENELPERLLAVLHIDKIDLDLRRKLYD